MQTLPLVLWLDLLGIFVFGISGGILAVRRGLDIVGIATLAVASGLAGGIARDVLLGVTPPTALDDPRYLLTAFASAICVFFFHPVLARLSKPVVVLDAFGLGFFAVIGCKKALQYGLEPLPAILLGVVTAVGGGVVRDIMVAEVPRVLREEIYAVPALIAGAIVVGGASLGLSDTWTALVATASATAIRLVSVARGWRAPRAPWS